MLNMYSRAQRVKLEIFILLFGRLWRNPLQLGAKIPKYRQK